MNVYETIQKFVKEKNYTQDEHVLGILFYGSSKYGLNNQNSDIDLLIIYDDSNNLDSPDNQYHLIRGNAYIDGMRIEYFKKTIREIHINAEEDFMTQSNASLSIVGKADIIYEKDNAMHELQEYVLNKFKNGLSPITDDRAREKLATISNRMERLRKYSESEEYGYYFEHLYNLIIEMIRRFYHEINGMPRIETSKGFKLYRNKQYQDMFSIDFIPDQQFLEMYFELIQAKGESKEEKLKKLRSFYDYAKRTVDFDKHNHRIPIKSRNYENIAIDREANLDDIEIEQIQIPEGTFNAVKKFMKEMNYGENEHLLGIIVYGSSLTGFNTKNSDIDLHVIFDNSNPDRLIRGKRLIDNNGKVVEIEYFEKPIDEEYLMAENEFLHQDNAALSILGKGAVVYAKDDSLEKLQKYVLRRFQDDLPPLSIDETREQISIMDNKIRKLENLFNEDSPYFQHFYHIVLEKMRETYHQIIGISQVPTDKVPRIYTDEPYRQAVCKTNPSQDFVEEYLRLVTLENDKRQMLEAIKNFYTRVKQGIDLGEEYIIPIESGLKHLLLHLRNGALSYSPSPIRSDMLAVLDKKRGVTTKDITDVMQLFEHLRENEIELIEHGD